MSNFFWFNGKYYVKSKILSFYKKEVIIGIKLHFRFIKTFPFIKRKYANIWCSPVSWYFVCMELDNGKVVAKRIKDGNYVASVEQELVFDKIIWHYNNPK